MKLLFTHSYFYKLDPKQWRFKQPYPPLATILAAAVLRNIGHQIIFFRHEPARQSRRNITDIRKGTARLCYHI
jgi:hypothetical protein